MRLYHTTNLFEQPAIINSKIFLYKLKSWYNLKTNTMLFIRGSHYLQNKYKVIVYDST